MMDGTAWVSGGEKVEQGDRSLWDVLLHGGTMRTELEAASRQGESESGS